MNAMKERRKNDRIPIHQPIFYTGKNSDGKVEEQGVGLALDISMGGMMFESNEPIDATHMSIRASFHKGTSVTIEGVLIYSMPYGEGTYRSAIQFKGESEQISSFFKQMCDAPR
jgi:hypothetical protein